MMLSTTSLKKQIPSSSTRLVSAGLFCILSLALVNTAYADDGTLRISVTNGWKAFEVITVNDNPSGSYAMPGTFDGMGAQIVGSELRVQINHELSNVGTISEVNLNLANFKTSVDNMVTSGSTGGGSFVNSAQQAYDRWSNDGGSSWTNTTDTSNTSFDRFCSGQSYKANTFGANRGFVDSIYITGEEFGATDKDRLFAIDLATRDMYQLSGVSGSAAGGIGGMPFDSWENAALLDTGETNHVALLLSPDGGTQTMQIYIGEKGKDENGLASTSFLARNGLAYGSHYYLNEALPTIGSPSTNGSFDTTIAGGLTSSKLEDVDTSLADPTKAVLGDQNSGLFTFDFNLDFSGGSFAAGTSGFSITKLQNDNGSGSNSFNNPDNVDWTDATTLNGTTYSDGLIFVNEDSSEGKIWIMEPDGTGLLKIGQTLDSTESTGILDISDLVGYNAGSVLLSNNQGSNSSLSVLINPNATVTLVVISSSWTAYNDFSFDPSVDIVTDPYSQSVHYTSPNVTYFDIGTGHIHTPSGELIKNSDGSGTGVTASLTQNESTPVTWQEGEGTNFYGGYDTAVGTDARDTFGGTVDLTGVTYYGAAGWWVDLTLTGLDPSKKYDFATTANRGGGYTDRLSIFTLSGTDGFTNSSTTGVDNSSYSETVGTATLASNQVRFNTGDNTANGYVARWTDIDPGADGTIVIRVAADPGSNDGRKAYAFDAIQLTEVPEPSTLAITSFTSLGGGNWNLTLEGEASTTYEFYSSTTLDFTSGTLVTGLTAGPGIVNGAGDKVTTDGFGDATVQMSLGAFPANFVRAVGP